MFKGSCHCGAVKTSFDGVPERLVACNCSICRRLRALWGHGPAGKLTVEAAEGATIAYAWGDKNLTIHSCKTCGVTTHWISLMDESPKNMALNFALMDPAEVKDIPIRHFDGADSWTFQD